MPIPAYDGIRNVLPPHLGDPTNIDHISPYPCSSHEVCNRFNSSPARIKILGGFLDLRQQIFGAGLRGFQWVGGSFVEDIETHERRAPNDIDVVTFVKSPATSAEIVAALMALDPNLIDRAHVKATFHVDHFIISLGIASERIVSFSRYWYALFSHRRDQAWKGMLDLPLVDIADDVAARAVLTGAIAAVPAGGAP
jgi:hypothetical protein